MADKPKKGTMHEKEHGRSHQPVSESEVASSLGGMHFPARRDDMEKWAKDHHARNEVIQDIHNMPDREYNSMSEVKQNLHPKKRK